MYFERIGYNRVPDRFVDIPWPPLLYYSTSQLKSGVWADRAKFKNTVLQAYISDVCSNNFCTRYSARIITMCSLLCCFRRFSQAGMVSLNETITWSIFENTPLAIRYRQVFGSGGYALFSRRCWGFIGFLRQINFYSHCRSYGLVCILTMLKSTLYWRPSVEGTESSLQKAVHNPQSDGIHIHTYYYSGNIELSYSVFFPVYLERSGRKR